MPGGVEGEDGREDGVELPGEALGGGDEGGGEAELGGAGGVVVVACLLLALGFVGQELDDVVAAELGAGEAFNVVGLLAFAFSC